MAQQFLYLNWNEYHLLAQKLAATILSHDKPLDEIIAISRGGLTFGHILSDLLKLPVSIISIQSYKDIKKRGKINLVGKLQKSIEGERILLVDDIADSGKTFLRAIEYMKENKALSITTVSMLYKPASVYQPDFFAKRTTKWVIFPYEVVETITSLTNMLEKQGKTKADIQNLLTSLGYREGQIAFVRKHHLGN